MTSLEGIEWVMGEKRYFGRVRERRANVLKTILVALVDDSHQLPGADDGCSGSNIKLPRPVIHDATRFQMSTSSLG